MCLSLLGGQSLTPDVHSRRKLAKRIRWDKGDLISYYYLTHRYLSLVDSFGLREMCGCSEGCQQDHSGMIDVIYQQIVDSLNCAAVECCPQTSDTVYKSYWDEEMSDLKSRAVETHQLWVACGKPRSGPVYLSRCRARAEYRRSMKCKRTVDNARISNDLHEQLLSKDFKSFWSTWRNKMGKRYVAPSVVDGCRQPVDIANVFAGNFAKACMPNNTSKYTELKAEFEAKLNNYSSQHVMRPVTVELLDKCLHSMKLGKAAGADNIEAEHLIYAHPILCVLLSLLFNCMIIHGRVPHAFGTGIVIPLLKDNQLDKSVADNYRGITLSSHVSKLFEMCMLELYGDFLHSADLQFGFKKHTGCNHALFTVKTVVDHYTSGGSVVNLCALDMAKAFDKVNHFSLFTKLMDRSLPLVFIKLLVHWYSLCVAVVRWDGVVSAEFMLTCGVRQGGVLSPVLFAVYVNSLIQSLSESGYGCHIGDMFIGCVMYADDILLLSASLWDLQRMIDVCSREAAKLDMVFNAKKSQALRVGNGYENECRHITINNTQIQFVDELKYLGWYIISAKCFKISLHHIRSKFYRSFNALYANSHYFCEPTLQYLVNVNCKPHLLYGAEVIDWCNRDLLSIQYTFNTALCRIYKVKYQSIATVYQYTGPKDILKDIESRRDSFLNKTALCTNSVVKCICEWFYAK